MDAESNGVVAVIVGVLLLQAGAFGIVGAEIDGTAVAQQGDNGSLTQTAAPNESENGTPPESGTTTQSPPPTETAPPPNTGSPTQTAPPPNTGSPTQTAPPPNTESGTNRDALEVVEVDSDLSSGEQGTVRVQLENTGEDAEDAVVNLQSLSGAILFTGSPNVSKFVGEWESGETNTIVVEATAAKSIATGEYPLQASLSYTDDDDQSAQAGPVTLGVEIGEESDDFEVVSTSSDAPIGDRGTVSVTLENTGEDVTEATVSLSSLSQNVVVGSTGNATRFVGEWDDGEQQTVEYQVRMSNDTEQQSYPLRTSVSYTDADGESARSDEQTFGVTPLREQTFGLSNVSGNLTVGDEGIITGTIVNEGPNDVRNAVLTLPVDNSNLKPQENEFALGTIAAGESRNFSFPIEVTDGAEGGLRQLSFSVNYDNTQGDPRTSDRLSVQVDVASQRDEFEITQRNTSVGVGNSETVELEITNNRNSTVKNINAKAFVDDPLSLDDDEAFVSELRPGESANVTFEVSAAGGATASTYPLSLDFQYDTADGESKLSDTYDIPIEVREPENNSFLSIGSGGLPILPVLLAVLVVVLTVVVVRRRNGNGNGNGRGRER
ncbi:COG1361 S-layer family protein [Halocatena marina]|uniref:COG1361 S-layer family protein n=1 Tax=Halocatena marina TaxID=2934937 RepID=UPI002224DF89|nr:COG1361 S-layer family protein [Halocatena marina]